MTVQRRARPPRSDLPTGSARVARSTTGARRVHALVRTSHPGPAVAVTTLAAAYATASGADPSRVLLVAAAVLAGQLSIGWANDLLDAARDRQVGRPDKPLATGVLTPATVRTACGASVATTVVLSLACGPAAGLVHLVCVAAGWAYDLGLKKAVTSWAPYAVAFGGLPLFVSLAVPGAPLAAWWVVLGTALLGVGAHLVNALPDLDDDEATGVRGLPHRLGARRAAPAAVAVLATATVVLAAGTVGTPGRGVTPVVLVPVVLVVAALTVVALTTTGRTPFRAAIGIAVADVALLVVAAR